MAMRMLDNVIDVNFYTIPEARRSNLRHRPVGLGLMGFQEALHVQRIAIASDAAVAFADRSMEAISFHADRSLVRSRRRARPLSELRRLAVVEGHPADRLARSCLPMPAAASTSTAPRRSTGTGCASR